MHLGICYLHYSYFFFSDAKESSELHVIIYIIVLVQYSVLIILPTTEWGDTYGTANVSFHQPSLPLQRDQALAIINKLSHRRASSGSVASEVSCNDDPALTSSHSIVSEMQFSSGSSGNSMYKSFHRDNFPDNSDQASVSEILENVRHSNDQVFPHLREYSKFFPRREQ